MTATAVHCNVSTGAGAIGCAIDASLELVPALHSVNLSVLVGLLEAAYIATISGIRSQTATIWIDHTVLAHSHNDIGIVTSPVKAVERDEHRV